MSEKQFVVNELEILNEENEWKGEYWWAVVNTKRVEDCFECRNKEVALRLCDFLNKATDDFKWQIRRCEKWSAIVKQLNEENEQLRLELETNKHPLWSTREAERKLSEVTNNLANEVKKNGLLNEEINQLRIENMRLKKKGGDGV